MIEKKIERLIGMMAAERVFLTAVFSSLNALGIGKDDFYKRLRLSRQFLDQYQGAIEDYVNQPSSLSPDQEEQELWKALGLGDLWRPSSGREPDEEPS